MTWTEFCKKAKELGYKKVKKEPYMGTIIALVNKDGYGFYEDGIVEDECSLKDNLCGKPFAIDRTYEQMYQIMEALK